jgi:hypothetical protein
MNMNPGVFTNVNILVDEQAKVRFFVNREDPDFITLAIGDTAIEITFDYTMIEGLRGKARDALLRRREPVASQNVHSGGA